MKFVFRVECPHCEWGYKVRPAHVNDGWLQMKCKHCKESFFSKIALAGVTTQTSKGKPEDVVVKSAWQPAESTT